MNQTREKIEAIVALIVESTLERYENGPSEKYDKMYHDSIPQLELLLNEARVEQIEEMLKIVKTKPRWRISLEGYLETQIKTLKGEKIKSITKGGIK